MMHVEKKYIPSTLDILNQASKLSMDGIDAAAFPPGASRRRKYLLDKLPERISPAAATARCKGSTALAATTRRRSRSRGPKQRAITDKCDTPAPASASHAHMSDTRMTASGGTMLGSIMDDIRLGQSGGDDTGLLALADDDGGSEGGLPPATSCRGSPQKAEPVLYLEGLLSSNRKAGRAKDGGGVPLHGGLQLLEDSRKGGDWRDASDGALVVASSGAVACPVDGDTPPQTAEVDSGLSRSGRRRKQLKPSGGGSVPDAFGASGGLRSGIGSDGQMPPFLLALEKQINSELAAIKAKTPQDGAPALKGKYTGSKYMDDRLAVFKGCARQLVTHFHKLGYGAVLNRVFSEYEGYAKNAQRQRKEALCELETVSKQRDEVAQQVQVLAANEVELDKRIREEAQKMYDMVRGGRTYFELAAELDEVKVQKERVKEANATLAAKVAKTKRLKEDFEHTIKAIEQTFEVMIREKDIALSETERRMRDVTAQHEERLTELKRVISSLRDQQDEADSEQDLIRAEVVILKEKLRQTQQQYESLHDEHSGLCDEHQKAMSKLAQHRINLDDDDDEGAVASMARKAVAVLPELGGAEQYETFEDLVLQILDILEARGEGDAT